MTPSKLSLPATRVVAPADHNWCICKYTRPGSGNLVYNEDANPFWTDPEAPKSNKKALMIVLVCIAVLAYCLI